MSAEEAETEKRLDSPVQIASDSQGGAIKRSVSTADPKSFEPVLHVD